MSAAEEKSQWSNPADVLSVMLLIGGEVVQAALAQVTAPSSWTLAPICFSFGWVTYSFSALISAIGDGKLMPEPDYQCKVINTGNGYARENRSWVLGRILRDHENSEERNDRFKVGIYEATAPGRAKGRKLAFGGFATICLQLGIAAIPAGLEKDWIILVITAAGTLLALITSALPQWRVEKHACRTHSKKNFILTRGNGSGHVMVILGRGECLDLEDLAAGIPPRDGRSWGQIGFFTKKRHSLDGTVELNPITGEPERDAILYHGLPIDFLLTRLACSLLAFLWIMLLITSSGVDRNAWFLMAVGGIGMIQNAFVAAIRRPPAARGLFIKRIDTISGKKVMDVLMDLEVAYEGLGRLLVKEFFPGELRKEEQAWWSGNRLPYDTLRLKEEGSRGRPRSAGTVASGKSSGRPSGEKAASPVDTKTKDDAGFA